MPSYSFHNIFPLLSNPFIAIASEDKPYYHALCVMANNFTTLLWQKYFNEMQHRFNIPLEALRPILYQTAENIAKDYQNALTGPLTRNDKKTIDRNLESLSGDEYKEVYRAFIKTHSIIFNPSESS